MDVVVSHRVDYDFAGRATVAEVAKSLVAQERLLHEAFTVLEELFPDLSITPPTVLVRAVAQDGPLKTVMEAMAVAAYVPELGQDMPDILNTLFGIDVPDRYDSIVSVLVLLIAIWGIDWLRARLFPGRKEKQLEEERQRLLQEAANRASVHEDHLEEVVERVLARRKQTIIKASADFLEPAKRHQAHSVSSGGASIAEQAIAAMPSDIEMAQYEPPREVQELKQTLIRFRAHDLDRNKAWAATIDAISPKRCALHFAPHVQPEALFERSAVVGDVIATLELNAAGEYAPTLYYLQKVYDDPAASV